jgi:hypothetical protein
MNFTILYDICMAFQQDQVLLILIDGYIRIIELDSYWRKDEDIGSAFHQMDPLGTGPGDHVLGSTSNHRPSLCTGA